MLVTTVGDEATTRAISRAWTWYWLSRRWRLNIAKRPKATISVSVTTTSCNTSICVASRASMRLLPAMQGPYRVRQSRMRKSSARARLQMIHQPLGEHLRMLPMHEVPAGHLLDDILAEEHSGRAPVVGGLGDRVVQPGEDDRRHRDSRLQRRRRQRRECGGIPESGGQARRVREARPDRLELRRIGIPCRRPPAADRRQGSEVIAREAVRRSRQLVRGEMTDAPELLQRRLERSRVRNAYREQLVHPVRPESGGAVGRRGA